MKKTEILKMLNKLIAENLDQKFDDPISYLTWFLKKCYHFFEHKNEIIFMNMQYILVCKRPGSAPIMRRLENTPNLINAQFLSSEQIFQTYINILTFLKTLQLLEVSNLKDQRDVGTPVQMVQQNFIFEIISQADIDPSDPEIDYNPTSHILTVALPDIYDGSVALKYYAHLRDEFISTHKSTPEADGLIVNSDFFEKYLNNFTRGLNKQNFIQEIELFFKRQDIIQNLLRYEQCLAKLFMERNIVWHESQQQQFIKMCFLHAWLKWAKYTYQIPMVHIMNHQDACDIGSFVVLSQSRLSNDLLNSLNIAFNLALNALKDYRFNEYLKLSKSDVEPTPQTRSLKNQIQMCEEDLRLSYKFESIVGHHPKMLEILKLISQVADTEVTVLIQGESGTGKELVAQAIHVNSRRRDMPLVSINCGAIPENLLESELFGHEKGAFTGACQRHRGKFAQADNGTIFLDEVDEMSPALQVKLLRILQWGEFSPLGSEKSQRCNVRIVAATKKALRMLVEQGKFRDDLYYRLNLICIDIPPLRERKEDILLLANYILQNAGKSLVKSVPTLTPEVQQILQHYHYPGNVRELENILKRAVILCDGDVIESKHLPPELLVLHEDDGNGQHAARVTFQESKKKVIENFERAYIQQLLKECHGNISQAAERAGMYERNFHLKLKRYGIRTNKN